MIAPVPTMLRRVKKFVRPHRRRFRVATRRARILPSFLVIGAQRAGTTSLFQSLRRHPDITGPASLDESVTWGKELHFFDEKSWRGIDWYRSFFPTSAKQRLVRLLGRDLLAGEATPYYMFHPAVPERVAAALPEVRLIALLRDPIERAYSHYQLMRRTGREKLSFEDALAAEEKRLAGERERLLSDPHFRGHHHRHRAYVGRSLYSDQLERWLAFFPREQLLVVRAEDFLARPSDIYAETLAFLGVRPWQPDDFEPRNRKSYAPIDPALRARLEERFAEPNERLARLLGRDFGWGSATAGPAKDAAELGRRNGLTAA
jgi:hypothetical protein